MLPFLWEPRALALVGVGYNAGRKKSRVIVVVRGVVAGHLEPVSVHSAPNASAMFQSCFGAPAKFYPTGGHVHVF